MLRQALPTHGFWDGLGTGQDLWGKQTLHAVLALHALHEKSSAKKEKGGRCYIASSPQALSRLGRQLSSMHAWPAAGSRQAVRLLLMEGGGGGGRNGNALFIPLS